MRSKKILFLGLILLLTPGVVAQREGKFLEAAKSSEIVVIAEVVENENRSSFWSGLFPSIQHIKYRVIKILKGDVESREIVVGHYVVANSFTADKTEPRLNPDLFKLGSKVILLMSSEGSAACKKIMTESEIQSFCSKSENFGVRPFSEKLAAKVEQAIRN